MKSVTCVMAWLCTVLMVPLMLFIWALDTKKKRIKSYRSFGSSWEKIAQIYGEIPISPSTVWRSLIGTLKTLYCILHNILVNIFQFVLFYHNKLYLKNYSNHNNTPNYTLLNKWFPNPFIFFLFKVWLFFITITKPIFL